MRLTKPKWSNRQLNQAAEKLGSIEILSDEEFSAAYDKVYDLRLAHAYPLRAVTTILRRRALAIDPEATVYSRAKRVSSIIAKLRRISTMKLTTMQDLGGCRAVVMDMDAVEQLREQFRALKERLPETEEYDYISEPKQDGYRSFHFVVRFASKNRTRYADVPSRRIEVQLRSRLQHQWATALETIDLFTEQSLKSGGGRDSWKRFFLLSSDLLALKEQCPRVLSLPKTRDELVKELRYWWDWLSIERLLRGWITVVYKDIPINAGENYNYLIETDIESKVTSVKSFPPENVDESYREYAQAEFRNKETNSRSAVLVSAYSLNQLREAFLSYYGDTTAFLDTLKEELEITDE